MKRWLIAAFVACAGILSAKAGANFAYAEKEFSLLPPDEDFVWAEETFELLPSEENFVWDEASFWLMPDEQDRSTTAMVSGVKARQRYPWNGLVDIVVTFTGEADDVGNVECLFFATNNATQTALPVEHITRVGNDTESNNVWTRKFVWDAAVDVGAVKIEDVALTVTTGIPLSGVQLWENGPYWAECNVGATKPEESGYYFMWGDTVGYKRNGDKWVAADGSNANFSFKAENCPTYDMTADQLLSAGYIDSTASSYYVDRALNHLLAKHDAATAHLGAPWRMPTGPEIYAIKENCDAVWMTRNGVYGCLVQGRGSYASRSIFLPAAGMGSESNLRESWVVEDGRCGNYWSSSIPAEDPDFGYPPGRSILLYFTSRGIGGVYFGGGSAGQRWDDWRFMGCSVRPVRMSVAGMYDATTHLALDCRTGNRVSAGTEELTFSNLWDGDAEATVTIAQDGAAIYTGLTGEGVKTWTVDRNGRYELTHTTYNNGVAGKVETAVFVVEGKEMPISELAIDWGQASFVYDGQPKEPVITVKDRGTTLMKGAHYLVEYKDNVNVGTAKAIVKGIEPYVGEVTNEFTIAAASIGPGGGEEPGSGVIPEGGLSKFDATYVYDGEGHTVNTQALYAVTLVGSMPSFSFSLDGETGWQNEPFVYTNVGEYVMWYKITAPNYEDYKHQAKVTIQPLVLTVMFDANGGSCSMASKTVTHGATYGTLPTPTWAGHIFAGWYTAASGGDEVKDSTAVSIMAPQTLYAHWVSVTGVSARQRYPWNGLVDIVVAFEGEQNDVAKVDCSFIAANNSDQSAISVIHITHKGSDLGAGPVWTRQFIWDAASDAGAVKIDDIVLTVVVAVTQEESELGGVQLWENGPYWAECNVGATEPEEYGYYFWWGDTVGYRRNGNSWDAVDGSRTGNSFVSIYCKTFDKSVSRLKSEGYIDSATNLVDKYDAARKYLGAPWRMPSDAEFAALTSKCKSSWTSRNGVWGRLIEGVGTYSSKSIFLPAAGYGNGPGYLDVSLDGYYWSSTPVSNNAGDSRRVEVSSDLFRVWGGDRDLGLSVRPVRGSAKLAATTCFALDCRTGDRVSAGREELTFSNLWDGDKEATVTIAQDGAAIFTGLTGEGVKTWTVDRNGRYELTHTTCNNGAAGKVETAVFVVEGKEVPVSELTIDWGQSSFVYDGQPKEPVITVKDRGTTLTKGTHYLVEYKDNVNVGTAKAIVTGIEPYVGVVMNTFTITKGTIPGGGEEPGTGTIPEGGLSKFDRTGVYNGKGQTIDLEKLEEAFAEVVGNDFTVQYAEGESGGLGQPALPAWTTVAPTVKDVGSMIVWYKVTNPNFEDFVHAAKVTVVPKELTDEMVQPGEDAFFFDGDDKKPTVDVVYEVDGKDICTENDYTLTYGTKAAAGWWVTVTGKGNYSGTVTKIVPVLKRPVAPPVVPSRSYNGKTQKPTIPTDSRWTVVANPGGVDVGEYTNVVLRLTNTTDYKWKGGAEEQTDITLVFKVTKANNGWSQYPDMKGWAYGETPSEPAMGRARYGTVQVAYRKEGADVSTETATRPELPGKYLARFWVDETENFIGVAVHEPYKDIAFEITGAGPEPSGDVTETTPVPVPHDWLDAYVTEFGGGDYETAANAKGKNGVSLWESYVAGLDPTDPTSQFTASITMGSDGKPVITWEPDMSKADLPRTYVEYGKANLGDKDWTPVKDANRAAMRFFKVGVEIK